MRDDRTIPAFDLERRERDVRAEDAQNSAVDDMHRVETCVDVTVVMTTGEYVIPMHGSATFSCLRDALRQRLEVDTPVGFAYDYDYDCGFRVDLEDGTSPVTIEASYTIESVMSMVGGSDALRVVTATGACELDGVHRVDTYVDVIVMLLSAEHVIPICISSTFADLRDELRQRLESDSSVEEAARIYRFYVELEDGTDATQIQVSYTVAAVMNMLGVTDGLRVMATVGEHGADEHRVDTYVDVIVMLLSAEHVIPICISSTFADLRDELRQRLESDSSVEEAARIYRFYVELEDGTDATQIQVSYTVAAVMNMLGVTDGLRVMATVGEHGADNLDETQAHIQATYLEAQDAVARGAGSRGQTVLYRCAGCEKLFGTSRRLVVASLCADCLLR